MFWRTMLALGALLLLMPMAVDPVSAQPRDRDRGWDRDDRGRGDDRDRGDRRDGEWELLGSTRIGGFGVDRDVIDVGRREGRFEKIGLEARDGSVFVLEVVVAYGNNEVQRINLRRPLRKGDRVAINLEGHGRAIRRIEVAARAGGGGFNRRAILDVYGEKGRDRDEAWELLGRQSVGFGVDRDAIRVGRREGRFEKIALAVKDNDVEILDLKVFFHRGPRQDIRVREFIRRGGRTRPIDLVGGDRVIDRIEIVYRARPSFRGRAVVEVYGLQAGRGGRGGRDGDHGGRWEELGCSKAGFLPDKDTIRVGRREGRFSQIQLRVSRNKVHIINLRVIYDRGPPDDIEVRSEIRDGGETRPLDLRGDRSRVIDRVELVYLAQPSLKGSAQVCVFGR